MSDEVQVEAIGIEVASQPIELYKILKIANVVEGGGEAKHLIAEGYVAVNGEIELRKRRKIYDGDVVYFDEEYYLVLCDTPAVEPEKSPKALKKKPAKQAPSQKNKQAANDKPTGRKPIRF